MKLFEIFVLFGGGYICGLSIGSGFAFQIVRKLFADTWNAKKEAIWIALAMPNILICTVMPVILVAVLVIGGRSEQADFWQRLGWLAVGVLTGGALVFIGAHLINVAARDWSKGRKT
jgi:hypothetical protein